MINTEKDKLRPVQFQEPSGGQQKKGWFHGWRTITDEDGTETVYGIVEREDGSITEAHSWAVKFLDRT